MLVSLKAFISFIIFSTNKLSIFNKRNYFQLNLYVIIMQEDAREGDETSEMTEESKADILALWRARCITPYNPELLPPEAMPLREEDVIIFMYL